MFVRGGQVKVVNSRFFHNRCDRTGPDLGGAAIRVLDQFHDQPVYLVHSTFGGAPGYGGTCSTEVRCRASECRGSFSTA